MDDTPTTVLVAERDEALREFLVGQFLADRFAAQGAQCAEEARVKLTSHRPDVLALGELGRGHEQLEPTRVYTKDELLREVWGFRALGTTRTVDAHACRRRRKLALAGAPNLVANVRGVGYRLCAGPVITEPKAVGVPLAANGRAA